MPQTVLSKQEISVDASGSQPKIIASRKLRMFEVRDGRLDLSGFWDDIKDDFAPFIGKKIPVVCDDFEKIVTILHYAPKRRIIFSARKLKKYQEGDIAHVYIKNNKIYIVVEKQSDTGKETLNGRKRGER